MKHILSYNESAGPGWRQVTVEEIDRRMSREQADTFTEAEVKAILDLVAKSGRHVKVWEYENEIRQLSQGLFISSEIKMRWLRSHLVNPDEHIGWESEIKHPGVPANNIYIKDCPSDVRRTGAMRCKDSDYIPFDTYKSTDDYFFVAMDPRGFLAGYYVCDGQDGLESMLGHFFEQRKE